MWDPILLPTFKAQNTKAFSIIEVRQRDNDAPNYEVFCDIVCDYTSAIVDNTVARRPWCKILGSLPQLGQPNAKTKVIQVSDFEQIVWEEVLSGAHIAASYLVRKGLSRKAQLALQIRRYLSKHSGSVLSKAVPHTVIVETWNAFEEMKLDFGGGTFASFNTSTVLNAPLRQRLDWCLDDVREIFNDEKRQDWSWILKSSVTNKGAAIVLIRTWDDILDALEDEPDIREWVLQKYVDNPLLVNGHKFHLRVYVLCVGAIKVFVFDQILMLLAAHSYDEFDFGDIYKHLTNTARSAEDIDFVEEKFVMVLDDLAYYLARDRPDLTPNEDAARAATQRIRTDIHRITGELFAAFENEYTVFAPMSNCFELYGLDFLVDDALNVSLLEVNPGPDFKQTGSRLHSVISDLWEQTCQIVIDSDIFVKGSDASLHRDSACMNTDSVFEKATRDFTLVYAKEWSASQLQGGMKLT